ncbi:MAG: four helix bundle protein [Deltaproteobacteria bacterium]|nr:four helix bundle protein [Deltaproteobacteria bacterium]
MEGHAKTNNVKLFAQQLEKRTLAFAVLIIRLSAKLPNTPEGRVVRNQVAKSGTSVGANYREVNRSRSKADFYHKIKICESEASETQYWLDVIGEAGLINEEDIQPVHDECSELVALFTTIAKKNHKHF